MEFVTSLVSRLGKLIEESQEDTFERLFGLRNPNPELTEAYGRRGILFMCDARHEDQCRTRQFALPNRGRRQGGLMTTTLFVDLCSTDDMGREPLRTFTLHRITLTSEEYSVAGVTHVDWLVTVKYSCQLL